MSNYLDLIEKEFELGLLSRISIAQRKRTYNNMNKKTKERFDNDAEHELNLLTKDKDFFIQTQILSSLKSIKQSNSEIKGWITFIGVMMIIGIIASLITAFG